MKLKDNVYIQEYLHIRDVALKCPNIKRQFIRAFPVSATKSPGFLLLVKYSKQKTANPVAS